MPGSGFAVGGVYPLNFVLVALLPMVKPWQVALLKLHHVRRPIVVFESDAVIKINAGAHRQQRIACMQPTPSYRGERGAGGGSGASLSGPLDYS